MTRRNRKLIKLAAVAGVVVAVGAFVAGPRDEAGAAITDQVAYDVGDIHVFSDLHRNASCSMNRTPLNTGDRPLLVIGTVSWPGHPEPLWPNSGAGANVGGLVIAPGEAPLFQWTNNQYLPDTVDEMILTWYVLPADDPTAQTGATFLEFIEPCRVVDGPPVDTTPPPVDTTPSSVPPSTVSTVPGPDTTTPSVEGPAPTPTTAVDTGVLTSSVGPLRELPATGAASAVLTALGSLAVAAGLVMVASARGLGRVSDRKGRRHG